MPGAAPRPHWWSRPVRAQWYLGQPFEMRAPIAQLLLGCRRREPYSLPLNKIPVLEGKPRKCRAPPRYFGPIDALKLLPKHPLRPAIREKMVEFDHQRIVVLC